MAGKKIGDAFIRVHPDTQGFGHEFKSGAEASGTEVGEGFARKLMARVAEIFAAEKVFEFLKGAVERAEESEKLGRATEAVVKSTGGAAKISADQVNELAGRLSALSGVDSELIRNGENVMLTFTRIRNEAGKGNDIFNQATEATLNLSAALHTDLQSATILVGKALNDPVKGVTALRRAGVQLTEQQTEQVKSFVKVGNIMGAQKIILGELSTEFAGAAEAASTPAARAKVAWQNFQEVLGGLFLPVIGKVADVFSQRVVPALHIGLDLLQKGWVEGAKSGAGFLQQFGAIAHRVFSEAADIIQHYLWPALKTIVVTLHDLIGWINQGSGGAQVFRAVVLGLVAALVAYKIAATAIAIATKAWAVAQAILDAAMDANPVGLIILAIIALAAGIFYLWTHSAAFRNFFIKLWGDIWGFLKAVGGWFAGPFAHFFEAVWDRIKLGLAFVSFAFQVTWNLAKDIVMTVWHWIEDRIATGVANIRAIMALIGAVVHSFVAYFEWLWNGVKSAWDKVVGFIKGIPGAIGNAIGNLGSVLYNAGADLIRGLWNGILSLGGWLASKVSGFISQNVPAPVRKLLGLGSPSRLFAQMGRDTVEGFAIGFTERAKQLAGTLSLPLPAAPGPGSGSGAGIVINTLAQDPVLLAKLVAREQAWATGV